MWWFGQSYFVKNESGATENSYSLLDNNVSRHLLRSSGQQEFQDRAKSQNSGTHLDISWDKIAKLISDFSIILVQNTSGPVSICPSSWKLTFWHILKVQIQEWGCPDTRESPPADNSVKIALPDPRPVVAPRQFVEHKTLQSTQLNQD